MLQFAADQHSDAFELVAGNRAPGLPSNETMFTTPVHFRIGRASLASNRAKQYPGNSGQSIFFLRSFHRLQRVIVGRNASKCLRSSCSRTTCS